MLRSIAVAAVVMALSVGCAAERGNGSAQQSEANPVVPAKDTFALGTSLTPEGAVPQNAVGETFTRGGELFLSINVEGASIEQEIEVEWVDPSGRVIRRDAVEVPKGSEYAAFSSGDTAAWRRGQHRAVIKINGRRVSERPFAVL